MDEPTVRKGDGVSVPLETWKLDGLEATVTSLQEIVDEAVRDDGVSGVYSDFGVRAFPGVLGLLRQIPPLIEEVRRARLGPAQVVMPVPGLYGKYLVFKSDLFTKGSGTNLKGCDPPAQVPVGYTLVRGEPLDGNVFVLRPEKDKAARVALMFYATGCEGDSPELARDLRAWVKRLEAEAPL